MAAHNPPSWKPKHYRREVEEELVFAIEVWSPDGNDLREVLGRNAHLEMAYAAYTAALRLLPREHIRLRQRGMLIRERRGS